jgi:hypothetical protein
VAALVAPPLLLAMGFRRNPGHMLGQFAFWVWVVEPPEDPDDPADGEGVAALTTAAPPALRRPIASRIAATILCEGDRRPPLADAAVDVGVVETSFTSIAFPFIWSALLRMSSCGSAHRRGPWWTGQSS